VSAVLHLRVSRDRVSAKAVHHHRVVWAGEAGFQSPDDLRHLVVQLASESLPIRAGFLRVKLELPLVQVRTLDGLPPVRSSALRALVAQQAGRFFRKNGKPLVVDAMWVRRVRGASGIAQAAAVEEIWIDALTDGAQAAGLVLETIRPSIGTSGCKLSLLSPAERARRRRLELLALRNLVLLAGILWVLAGVAFTIRVQREQRRIDRALAALEPVARAVDLARRDLTQAAVMVETIERVQRERGIVLHRLAAITAALPDSAYLTSLDLRDSAGTVSGLAPRAASVVAAFEQTPVVAAPRLSGPAVREAVSGKDLERFAVTFRLRVAP
jgi:hypothetical protein